MQKPIKIALLDFDGTLVTKDILDVLCGFIGKARESQLLNEAFHRGETAGLASLVSRINLLKGMTTQQVAEVLSRDQYLMPGALELMNFFHQNHIVTILASGNILPVLEYYQQVLGITHVVGSQPKILDDMILGIDETAFSSPSFKVDGIKKVLENYSVTKENIIALGDSPSDKGMFELSGFSIAVNPKGDLAKHASAVIGQDLNKAVQLLQR